MKNCILINGNQAELHLKKFNLKKFFILLKISKNQNFLCVIFVEDNLVLLVLRFIKRHVMKNSKLNSKTNLKMKEKIATISMKLLVAI